MRYIKRLPGRAQRGDLGVRIELLTAADGRVVRDAVELSYDEWCSVLRVIDIALDYCAVEYPKDARWLGALLCKLDL